MASFFLVQIFVQTVYATGDPNIDGGGGGMGDGTNNNGWAIRSKSGELLFDADGLRVYIVSATTGVKVSNAVDITNSDVAESDVRNGRGKTKNEYRFVDSSLNIDLAYTSVKINTSQTAPLPQIIPWDESGSAARIEAIKMWFLDTAHADWIFHFSIFLENDEFSGGYTVQAWNGVQLVYVKWKTPNTPRTLTICVTSDKGYFFNQNSTNEANRYVGTLSINSESNVIRNDGNIYDDWYVAPVKIN